MKVWELKTGRTIRTIDAHSHFVTAVAWGRMRVDGGASEVAPDGVEPGGVAAAAAAAGQVNGGAAKEGKVVNVVATCSVDLSIKIWTP